MKIRTTTIELGEREFEVKEMGWKRAAAWRQTLLDGVKPLFDEAASVSDMTFDTPDDLLQLWPFIESIAVNGIDVLMDHLLAYSADLEADREYIEEYATVAQVANAFVEVAKFAIPFEILQSGMSQMNGSPAKRLSAK